MKQKTKQASALIETVRSDVNDLLATYFEEKTLRSSLIDDDYLSLWKSLQFLSASGGKRLRPFMTYVAYRLYGGKDEVGILALAASQELLHIGMLIHDDIIDRDDIRYGVKNIQGIYDDIYHDLVKQPAERQHYARSAALLGGDLLLSSAYEIVLDSSLSDPQKLLAQRYLSNSIFTVIGGELLDTEASIRPAEVVDPIKIALLKTSSYSFVSPLSVGAAVAGADEDQLSRLRTFGEALGIAFQLADDLLGVFGNEEITGKSNSGDISEGKRTLLIREALQRATDSDRILLERLYGKHDITPKQLETVKAILVRSGAKQFIEEKIEQYANQSREALNTIVGDDRFKVELNTLISLATKRSK